MAGLARTHRAVRRSYLVSVIILAVFCIAACDDRETLAPVVESNWRAYHDNASQHIVRSKETLYSIAFRYDQDYRQLAARNHINPPYLLAVGQVVYLKSQASYAKPQRQKRTRSLYARPMPTRPQPRGRWAWPARGPLLASFVPAQGKKGIDIAGHKGQSVYATAGGVVAYAGDGLAGYGNLILIKHDNQYLSAYGYNARNLVHVGQTVRAGQPIAAMGMNHNRRYALHFEIRKAGIPVNPSYYLR